MTAQVRFVLCSRERRRDLTGGLARATLGLVVISTSFLCSLIDGWMVV